MENCRQIKTMIQKLKSFEVQKKSNFMCVKAPFCKSGHK